MKFNSNSPQDALVRQLILAGMDHTSFLLFLKHLETAENADAWKDTSKMPQFERKAADARMCTTAWEKIKNTTHEPAVEDPNSPRFRRMKGGMTNDCFDVRTASGKRFFLRVPGQGSDQHLSREDEAYNLSLASQLGITVQTYAINPTTGLYLGEFIEDGKPLTADVLSQEQTMRDVADIFKRLHSSPHLFKNNIDIFTRLEDLINKIDAAPNHVWSHNRESLKTRIALLRKICEQGTSTLRPCHNDPTPLNFLYTSGRLTIFDFEYSGNNYPMFDLANFATIANISAECKRCLLTNYIGDTPSAQDWKVFEAYEFLTHVWYYLWAELQLANKVPKEELHEYAEKHWQLAMQAPIVAHTAPRPSSRA